MAENDKKQKNYRIECIEDENGPVSQETKPETLMEDPMSHFPDVSSQTGGIPVVTFVLTGLSAGFILLIRRMLDAQSALVTCMGVVVELVIMFGAVVLFCGTFQKLRNDNADPIWYPLSAVIMIIGITIGAAAGILV